MASFLFNISNMQHRAMQFDQLGTRYKLISDNDLSHFNWLFLPGGPGASSNYFESLLDSLILPGKIWLIDFPSSGDNIKEPYCPKYDFDRWDECLIQAIKKFVSPILVGHSFGSMHPLLFPEIESLLKGFVILSAAPVLWHDEVKKLIKENNINLAADIQHFESNPNLDTFNNVLINNAPRHFPPETLAVGSKMLANTPFNYFSIPWWEKKVKTIKYSAKWFPSNIPTLILGGTYDYVMPLSLFKRDTRFHRDNITIEAIDRAGHFPWIEAPELVARAFEKFKYKLSLYYG